MKYMSERSSKVTMVTVPIGGPTLQDPQNTRRLFYMVSPKVQQLPAMKMELEKVYLQMFFYDERLN